MGYFCSESTVRHWSASDGWMSDLKQFPEGTEDDKIRVLLGNTYDMLMTHSDREPLSTKDVSGYANSFNILVGKSPEHIVAEIQQEIQDAREVLYYILETRPGIPSSHYTTMVRVWSTLRNFLAVEEILNENLVDPDSLLIG